MLQIGRYNQLAVHRVTATGAWLATEAGEILLPLKYVRAALQQGDTVTVFVYRDSEDRLVATTVAPKVQAGQFAVLKVTDVGRFGAFLDWGLDKELLVPFSEQATPLKTGESCMVGVYLDNSGRLAASTKIGKFLDTADAPLQVGDEVELQIWEFTDLGAKVIINGRYPGLLFKDELYGKPTLGTKLQGYVKKIRDDKKIDVTLRKSGSSGIEGCKEKILKTLAATGGYLPLGDKSPPDEIDEVLGMSKKAFKKAVGSLYKEGSIELTRDGIRLRNI
jgi:predicted RNA-binding protein (virulence factor B family)